MSSSRLLSNELRQALASKSTKPFTTRPRRPRWVEHDQSWHYVDSRGMVHGRIDRVEDAYGQTWYWWQTESIIDAGLELTFVKQLVERTLGY